MPNTTTSGTAITDNSVARSTMSEIITQLRELSEASVNEYTVNNVAYWNDGQLQTILDRHRTDFIYEDTTPNPIVGAGGTSIYKEYLLNARNLEQTSGGTAVFYLQDGTGANVGTSLYSVDYLRGVVTFAADTGGSSFFWTGRAFDLNASAADVWRKKAAHYHSAFSFTTDNHSIKRGEVYQHCVEMADYYESVGAAAVVTMEVFRSDTDVI